MVKESLKLVIRKMLREKVYTGINILGLAVAFTAALLIYSHIVKEWNTDRFHIHGKEIYRVVDKSEYAQNWSSLTSAPVGPYTKAEYAAVRQFVRVERPSEFKWRREGDTDFSGKISCIHTDPQFFEVFTFPVRSGGIAGGMEPDWVVVSEQFARHSFPGKNPVGEMLYLKDSRWEDGKERAFRVVAVMADIPESSTLQADVVADFSYREREIFNSWGMHGVYTYFQLDNRADIPAIEKAIPEIIERNYHWIKASEHATKLQPLQDIYFHSDHIQEDVPHGSIRLNLILCGITLLILILASCNYWMIKLAGLTRQAGSLAIQRCFGAGNIQLKRLLFLETLVHLGGALVIAVGAVILLHPWFVRIISPKHPYPLHFAAWEIVVFVALLVLFALCVTWMLAFYMLRRLDRAGIKNAIQPSLSGRLDIKKILSVVQMCIFAALLFCSVVLVRQMNFIRDRELGFDNERVIQFAWQERGKSSATLRSELMRNPDILSMSNGFELPLSENGPKKWVPEQDPDMVINAYVIYGDAYYLDTYRIRLLEGRNIREDSYPADPEEMVRYRPEVCPEILINRKFAQQLGKPDPVGTIIRGKDNQEKGFRVVGVMDDFHFLPLYRAIEPAFLIYDVPFRSYSMLVRYREGKRSEVLAWLKQFHEEKFVNVDFWYREYSYSQLYDKDIAIVRLINIFTLIAILISGMGIFAFSMFMVENRMREIALRKVNGASEWQIVCLLNRNFAVRVFWACLIGLPVAHYAVIRWLEGFAYKTTLDWWMYGMVILASLVLVLLVTTWQTWRAATINPIKILKDSL